MDKEKLKQAKIKEGNICLEGRILQNPQFIALKTLSTIFGKITDSDEEKQNRLYENIVEHAPEEADLYVLGVGFPQIFGLIIGEYNAILYLNSRTREER